MAAAVPTAILDLELRGAVGSLCDALEAGNPPPECLLVGAAGTGKTFGILLLLHLLALRRADLRVLVCRKTRESLTESVLVTYEQEVLSLTGHRWMAEGTKRRVRQAYHYPNGTEWIVGGLDRPSKILSTSYDIVFANEAIELEEEDWETIQSRIGRPERAHPLNCLIGDTNPGVPSHWLKARCDRGQTVEWVSHHRDNPGLWQDGRWTPEGEAYRARLGRLTGARRKRLFEGMWAAGEAQWFDRFGEGHVSVEAEYDPTLPVHLAVDSGVHTGAVWFQVHGGGEDSRVRVFASYYAFNRSAFDVGREIIAQTARVTGGRMIGRFDRGTTDPAGNAATGIGTSVLKEYARAGLILSPWPSHPGSVIDGLALIESFVSVDPPALLVHPRCTELVDAFANYRRAKRGGQFIDRPEDPQHPHEDLMDALRGGLMDKFPAGRVATPRFHAAMRPTRFFK